MLSSVEACLLHLDVATIDLHQVTLLICCMFMFGLFISRSVISSCYRLYMPEGLPYQRSIAFKFSFNHKIFAYC